MPQAAGGSKDAVDVAINLLVAIKSEGQCVLNKAPLCLLPMHAGCATS